MTKTQKLQTVIEYARNNGADSGECFKTIKYFAAYLMNNGFYKVVLFNHNFAKAVFCDNRVMEYTSKVYHGHGKYKKGVLQKCYKSYKGKHFKHHLKEAVVSNDPIGYYYDFIKRRIK